MKKRISILVIIIVTIFIHSGCSLGESRTINQTQAVVNISYPDFQMYFIDEGTPYTGIGFNIVEKYNESLVEPGHLSLETPQDEIVISVSNAFYQKLPVLLTVFYNYEQVSFQVAGDDEYRTTFIFNLESGYQVNIPIQLSSELEINDHLNSLMIGVFENPEELTKNVNPLYIGGSFHLVLNWSVSYNGENQLVLPVPYQEPTRQLRFGGVGIIANPCYTKVIGEYQDGVNEVEFIHETSLLTASPGEVIEFSFFVNPLTSTDFGEPIFDYLIITMLDWQQVSKSGQPYLFVEGRYDDLVRGIGDYITFTITMPDEPGLYEFISFVVPNPTTFNNEINDWPFEMGRPFTILIIE